MSDSATQSVRQIGVAVVEWKDQFLVGWRGAEQVLAGHAEFPGGKCEPGETPAACAERECLEETGLAVTASRCLIEQVFEYPHATVHLHFWLCRPVTPPHRSDSRLPDEGLSPAGNFRWVCRSELPALPFPEANAALLQQLITHPGR